MEIKVLNKDKGEMTIQIIGETHSFCSPLQYYLLHDDTIEFAGYTLSHPLVGNIQLNVITKGRRRPENALLDASKALNKTLQQIQNIFLNALTKVSSVK